MSVGLSRHRRRVVFNIGGIVFVEAGRVEACKVRVMRDAVNTPLQML